jgi:hypothetical protein
MDLWDYAALVAVWILGAIYGWYARERQAKRTIDNFFNQVEETIAENIEESILKINIEQHNGMFFVYDKETNDFMAQGKTKQELEENLAKRYPDKRFAADKENLRILK